MRGGEDRRPSASRRPYVFGRFERAVPSSRYGGLGLGLTVTLPCGTPEPSTDQLVSN